MPPSVKFSACCNTWWSFPILSTQLQIDTSGVQDGKKYPVDWVPAAGPLLQQLTAQAGWHNIPNQSQQEVLPSWCVTLYADNFFVTELKGDPPPWDLGWVDKDLRSFPGWWVGTYCQAVWWNISHLSDMVIGLFGQSDKCMSSVKIRIPSFRNIWSKW